MSCGTWNVRGADAAGGADGVDGVVDMGPLGSVVVERYLEQSLKRFAPELA